MNRTFFLSLVVFFAVLFTTPVPAADVNPLRQFFPYGVYAIGKNPELVKLSSDEARAESIERVCKDLAEHNMNCAWINNLNYKFLPMWLKAGRKHGIRIIPQGGGPPAFVRASYFKDKNDFARQVEPFYREMADKYRDDPALLAWSCTEENEPIPWFFDSMAELNRKMAQWDPNHPIVTIDFKATSAWMNACIVKPKALCRDQYLFFADGMHGPYQPLGFRSLLTRACERFREAADKAGGVFWFMGQGMKIDVYLDGIKSSDRWRYPTTNEMRWQVWAAIQEGAKGFFFFIYRYKPNPKHRGEFIQGLRDRYGRETEQFRAAAQLGHQLKPLMPLILELDIAPPHKTVVYWENTPVTGRTFIHRKTGQRFLITVNHDCENIQPIGIELGYFPGFVKREEKAFDLRTRGGYDYHTFKLATIQPGDGTIFFVGTDEDWSKFASQFYQ